MSERDLLRLTEVRRMAADGRARAVRLAVDATQAEFGDRCGVTSTTILRWEKGERVPRGPAALRYARLLERLGEQLGDTAAPRVVA